MLSTGSAYRSTSRSCATPSTFPSTTVKTLNIRAFDLRMDFRDPNTVGTFVYHCHLLEHEDGGMMGLIRVEPGGSLCRLPKKVLRVLEPADERSLDNP